VCIIFVPRNIDVPEGKVEEEKEKDRERKGNNIRRAGCRRTWEKKRQTTLKQDEAS